MSDKNLQDMDKKEKQPEKGMDTSNTVPSSQDPSPSTQHPTTTSRSEQNTEQALDPDHPVHCKSCGLEYYYVGGLSHNHLKDWKPEPHDDTKKDKMDHGQASSNFAIFNNTNRDEMDRGLPSPCYTTFAGVTLDQTLPGQISAFHFLKDDGESFSHDEEWNTVATNVGGYEKLQSFLKMGVAAVRVRIENVHLQGPDARTVEMSGFRLDRNLVVTCAHFTKWDLHGNNVQYYLNGQNGQCYAFQDMVIQGLDPPNRFTLRLHAIHEEWDIAIFRITAWPANDNKKTKVEKGHLYLATPEDRRALTNGLQQPYWSVGYNFADNMEKFKALFGQFFNRRHDDEKAKISQEYNFNASNPPPSEFFKKDWRTVSFGTRIAHPVNAKPHQECVELSAWHGRSGSMVCTVIDGSARIIGMIQGGTAESDCNLFLLFTKEMAEWLNAATAFWDSADPQEMSKRIVMK